MTMTGQIVGHYEVLDRLGEGGMGVVYRARDTRLHRQVALKFLTADSTADHDSRRRFLREAQAASALNHPHIITIYDVGSADGRDFIAMELVAGRPLDSVIGSRGMRPAELVRVALQLADALATAHDAGIVHRDLKPANVMITGSGQVKILDFGLAKSTAPLPADDKTASIGAHTIAGSIVGTVAYMSPEQAEGRPVDQRSDIFSFGVMLYEMATGQRPFVGESTLSTLSAVLEREPKPVTDLVPDAPRGLVRLISRCLNKNPGARYQDTRDVVIALQDVRDDLTVSADAAPGSEPAQPSRRTRVLPIAALSLIGGLVLGAVGWWAFGRTPADSTPQAFEIRRITADAGLTTDPTISADGKFVAYASDRTTGDNLDIWVQQIEGGSAIRVTSDPADEREPDFSPDGSRIVFRSDRDGGGLYVVSSFGGEPRFLSSIGHYPRYSPDGRTIAFWDGEPASGILYVAGDARILTIPADGGAPAPLLPDFAVAFPPVWLTDRTVIFWGQQMAKGPYDWWVASLDGANPQPTGLGAAMGEVGINTVALVAAVTEGSLVFGAGQRLWRVAIGANGKPRGPIERVSYGTSADRHPSQTRDGSIAFFSGSTNIHVWSLPIVANDIGRGARPGTAVRLTDGVATHQRPSVTRDGRWIGFGSDRSGNDDAWIMDASTGVARPIASTSWPESNPVASPDGMRIAYGRGISTAEELYVVAAAGGTPTRVCERCGAWNQWTSDGAGLVTLIGRFDKGIPKYGAALYTPDGTQTWRVEHSQLNIFGPRLSADGRWLSVSLNQGQGRSAIWVIPIGATGPAAEANWIRVTPDGYAGKQDWSPDGNVLYYYSKLDGFGCIYAQRLDATKRAIGEPIGVSHWHGARRSLNQVGLGQLNLYVAADKIVFNLAEQTGNVWLLRPSVTR